ncbi:MAG TPA: hypothetical protein VFJ43_06105, partial [Bacteroidia bacterium]|nr:hypothetical protein [Bacteroidia bacterium]
VEVALSCEKKVNFSLFADPVGPYLIGDDLCRGGKIEDGHRLLTMCFEKISSLSPKQKDKDELGRYSAMLTYIIADADKFGFKELTQPATDHKKIIDDKLGKLQDNVEMNYPGN